MKIGVVSDTHSREVPKQLFDDFKCVDFIIHAGDFCTEKDYNLFGDLKEVKAVRGNMDDKQLSKRLADKELFQVEGCTIGLFHGEGPARRVLDYVKERFKEDKVDAVVYGHSHIPFNEVIDGVLYFNPGSPNDDICAPYCSYGMLEIKDGSIEGKIIKVK